MSQSYNKPCIYCKHEIVMSDKGVGKWLPYDLNGSMHECKQTGTKKEETNRVYTGSGEVIAVLNEAIELLQTCRKMLDQKK